MVDSLSADWFSGEHIPLMKAHVRSSIYADMIAERIQNHLAAAAGEGMIGTPKETAQFMNLLNNHAAQAKMIKTTATAMRLCQSAVYDREKIRTRDSAVSRVWED